MRRQRPLALAKEIAAELRAKYERKQHSLPVNVCLLRSSIMIRAAPWEVLGTSAAAGRSARLRAPPKPPQRKLQRWRLAHHSTLASRRVGVRPAGARAAVIASAEVCGLRTQQSWRQFGARLAIAGRR